MYTCNDCQKDPRTLSKDKTHRLCTKCMCEITIEECNKLKDK